MAAKRGFCGICGRPTDLREADFPASEEGGIWFQFGCECGNCGFIRERDLALVDTDRWAKVAEAKRQKAGIQQKTDNLRAHWLN